MEREHDQDWSKVLPPQELTAFLRGIKLEHLDVKLAEHGYDDVDDLAAGMMYVPRA